MLFDNSLDADRNSTEDLDYNNSKVNAPQTANNTEIDNYLLEPEGLNFY